MIYILRKNKENRLNRVVKQYTGTGDFFKGKNDFMCFCADSVNSKIVDSLKAESFPRLGLMKRPNST